MFIDWAHVVREAVTVGLPDRLDEAGLPAEAEKLRSFAVADGGAALGSLIEVEDPPAGAEARVSTPLCFKLSGILSEASPDRLSALKPHQLAELLAAEINRLNGADFTASPSPSGHVNGNPTPGYLSRFVSGAAAAPAEIFYGNKPCGLEREPASFVLEPIPELTFNWKKLQARAEDRSGEERYELAAVLSRAQSAGEQRRSAAQDFGAFLVLLALVADDDFTLRVYARGIAGRENVPWYLDRFRSAVRSFIEQCDRELEPPASAAHGEPSRELEQLLQVLLYFRGRFRTAVRMHRPEFLLSQILRGARAFFAFYNRPEFRSLDCSVVPPAQLATARQLSGILEGAALGGTELLYRTLRANPCESPG